ncbi:MAG: hypothetical protein WBA99_06100 [Nodosilinea sp.]
MVDSTELAQSAIWAQARAGDLGAIAHLLTTAIDSRLVRVELSRRDRTLYVFLTHAQSPQLESYVHAIHRAVRALGLETITQLKVIDGTEKRLLNRWQYNFDLEPGAPRGSIWPVAKPDTAEADASPSASFASWVAVPNAAQNLNPNRSRHRRWQWVGLMTAIGWGAA